MKSKKITRRDKKHHQFLDVHEPREYITGSGQCLDSDELVNWNIWKNKFRIFEGRESDTKEDFVLMKKEFSDTFKDEDIGDFIQKMMLDIKERL